MNPLFHEFKARVVVVEPILPVFWLLKDTYLEGVCLEAGVENIDVEIADFVGINIVRQGFVVGLFTCGVGDLFLVLIVLVNENSWRREDVHLLKIKRDGTYRDFFSLTQFVLSVDPSFNVQGIGGAVQVALGHFELQFRDDRRAPAVEGVGAAWCAPLRVGPTRGEVGFQIKHNVDAA